MYVDDAHDVKTCQKLLFFFITIPEELKKSGAHEAGACLPSIVRVPSTQLCWSGHSFYSSRCYHCCNRGDWIWEEGGGGGMFQDKLSLSKLRALDVQRVDTDRTPV